MILKDFRKEGVDMGGNYQKSIYNQLMEVMELVDSLKKELMESKKQLKWDLKTQELHLREEFAAEKRVLMERIEALEKENAELKEERRRLLDDNRRMKSILNNNSTNSSLPPSSDQKGKKANTYNSRKKTGKTKGGQKGHAGKGLTRKDVEEKIRDGQLNHVIEHIGNSSAPYISKYVLDLMVTPVAKELRFHADGDGKFSIPEERRSDVTYGEGVKAIAVHLYGEGVVSNERICSFINALCDGAFHLSEGSVYNFCKSFAKQAEESIRQIESELLNSDVLYTDATAVSVNGNQTYIRNQSTERAVLYSAMGKKNIDSIGNAGILGIFTGILVHDHETALYHFGMEHGECNAHILRYLAKNTEETGNVWSGEMSALLREMNRAKKDSMASGAVFTEEQMVGYESRYSKIIEKGKKQNNQMKKGYARDDEAALLNRMEKYKGNHLLFARDFRVDFTNNMSERDLRKCKNRQKMSGGFRQASGSEMYCRILSVIETCKRKGMQVLKSIGRIFAEASPIF